MKFCLSSRQTDEYLQKADEIKVQYRDKDSIFDLIEKYPDKTIILDCFGVFEIDWKEIERDNILCKNNFIVCVNTMDQMRTAQSIKVRRYLGFPIMSFYELNAIAGFEPEYILLDTELFFRMNKVLRFNIPIRVVPNVAYNDALPRENGIHGTWIRPEDLASTYEGYVTAVEFADCDREKEQALFRIYAEKKEWRTDLNLIITNLDVNTNNRMISREVGLARLNCGHKCQEKDSCHICERALKLAHPDLIKDYIESPKEPI